MVFALATVEEALAAGFGAVAALVLLGGSILLRWQRSRQQFLLMQSAIERGTNLVPGGPPFWLLSLRQGVLVLTLGCGLVVVGAMARRLAANVPLPSAASYTPAARPAPGDSFDGPGGPMSGPPEGGPAFGRPGRRFGPGGGPPGAGFQGPGADRPPPGDQMPPDPSMQRWHRAQVQESVGLLAMGCGVILALLGIVRMIIAGVERRYSAA
jgi:hypothetical protein